MPGHLHIFIWAMCPTNENFNAMQLPVTKAISVSGTFPKNTDQTVSKKKKKGRKKGGKKRGHMTSKNKGTVKMKYTKKLWRKLFFIALVNRSF